MEKGNKLTRLRENRGMTQSEVAETLDVTRQAVSQWERGVSVPSAEKILALSRLYGVAVEELLQSEVGLDMLSGENCPDKSLYADRENAKRTRFDGKYFWPAIAAGICALICLWGIFCHSMVIAIFLLLSLGSIALIVLIICSLVRLMQEEKF